MLSAPRRRSDDDERILPLINIVFLLLIFFMLAGRLSASNLFAVTPPRSLSEGQAAAAALEIQLAPDGRIAIAGKVVELAALPAILAEELSGTANRQVRLKADGSSETASVVDIMELLRGSGVERVQLLTMPVKG